MTEFFRPVSAGVEQLFEIAAPAPGTAGQAELVIPVSGLRASGSGRAVELRSASGNLRAVYAGLRVYDSAGKRLRASMNSTEAGRAILIRVDTDGAAFPILVDPTWSSTALFDDGLCVNDAPTQQCGITFDSPAFGEVPLAVSPKFVAVGAIVQGLGIHPGSIPGVVCLFTRNDDGTWSESLVQGSGAGDGAFGQAVAFSGNTLFVGDPNSPDSGDGSGEVRVYNYEAGTGWSQVQTIAAPPLPPPSDQFNREDFGTSVLSSGGNLMVSNTPVDWDDGVNTHDPVWLYSRDADGHWTLTATLAPPDDPNGSGYVSFAGSALSATTAVVSAITQDPDGDDSTQQGEVFIYQLTDGVWSGPTKLVPDSPMQFYGEAAATDGDRLLVSQADDDANDPGQVFAYRDKGGAWTPAGMLPSPDPGPGDEYGDSIAMLGSTAVIGEPYWPLDEYGDSVGSVYWWSDESGDWQLTHQVDGQPLSDTLGEVVALTSGFVAALSRDTSFNPPFDPNGGLYDSEGTVYLFSSTEQLGPEVLDPIETTGGGGRVRNSV
ncbi:MAG TPA: hypothetical protein VHC43_02370 [Mycobacteriales bacterium]|nr:hypothetical protein [Mycobacteriales bacterium]